MPSPSARGRAGGSRPSRTSSIAPCPRPGWVVVALWLALWLPGCDGASEQHARTGPPVPAVEVIQLASEPLLDVVDLLGELQASESVLVKSEIAAVIESVNFEEGQRVVAGVELFRLRDREQQARLAEAQARLALAGEEFDRTRRLADRNVAAAVQIDRTRAELEVAKAEVMLRRAELDRTRVRVPFDGQAGARLVSPGARVTPDDPLVRIDAMDPLRLVFSIPEWALPLARIGAGFEVTVAAYPSRRFPGAIDFVAPNVESATRRILIKGRVPNPEGVLLPGMFAQVTSDIGARDALLVPEEALVNDPDGVFVWRLDGEDNAARARIEIGARQSGRVEVRSGLSAGDRIVSAGTHKVRDGSKVRVVPAPAVTEPDAPPSAAALGGGDA